MVKASAAAVTAGVLGALALGQPASAAQPGGFRYSEQPSGFRYSAVQPNPLKWGVRPEGFRWSKADWQRLRLTASKIRL